MNKRIKKKLEKRNRIVTYMVRKERLPKNFNASRSAVLGGVKEVAEVKGSDIKKIASMVHSHEWIVVEAAINENEADTIFVLIRS